MKYTVYHVVNRSTGKGYVGWTKREPRNRWASHLSAARQQSPYRFHSAIRKYGPDDWNLEILLETTNEMEARKFEEEQIYERGYLDKRKGYNAKPGGCGGWIVPDEKYESWKEKLSESNSGSRNGNALETTNEELLEAGIAFVEAHGYIPGLGTLIDWGASRDVIFPKSFTKYRFGGFKRFQLELEKLTGVKYINYYKSVETRKKISDAGAGKHWYHNDELKLNKQLREADVTQGWKRGRKKWQ